MANIDFSDTPIAITMKYSRPDNFEQIATAPGGYNATTLVIKDETLVGIAIRGFKTNNEIILKDNQEIKFKVNTAAEAAHFRNYARVEGMTVTINGTAVDPTDIGTFNDLIDDERDVVTESTEDEDVDPKPEPDPDPEPEPEPTKTLSVNPTELTIVKGQSATATISNASGTVTAESDKPSIEASVDGTTVTVTAQANAAASATVTLTDEASNTATIAITTTDSEE